MARAKNLLGPWEKYARNPILADDEQWRCPGHGTVTEKDDKFYFLYHAYDKQTSVYTGRQALLRELTFVGGWPEFRSQITPTVGSSPVATRRTDSFTGKTLSTDWQWSVFRQPRFGLKRGRLTLTADTSATGSAVGQRTLAGNYTATTTIHRKRTSARAGLAAIGDDDNAVGISANGRDVMVWKVERRVKTVIATQAMPNAKSINLRLTAQNGHLYTFAYATDGKTYQPLATQPVDGAFLPPWDRAVRVGSHGAGFGRAAGRF